MVCYTCNTLEKYLQYLKYGQGIVGGWRKNEEKQTKMAGHKPFMAHPDV
jgi:hypothetical protein